jgi:hypothetical protein
MKKILLLSGFLLLAVAIFLTFPCYKRVFAVDGCCKDRDSLTGSWRKKLGMSFKECESLNRKDGDNVLDQRGLVWWDVQCR